MIQVTPSNEDIVQGSFKDQSTGQGRVSKISEQLSGYGVPEPEPEEAE
jgi:hypothetical protein